MLNKMNDKVSCAVIFCVSLFIFSQNLDILSFEFRDEEIYNHKISKEIYNSGHLLTRPDQVVPGNKNPVFFYWLAFLSYKFFGPEWASARMVSAFFGSLTLLMTWLLTKQMFGDKNKAFLSVIILLSSKLFFRHARAAVPEMLLTFFIVLSFYFLVKILQNRNTERNSLLLCLACSFGFFCDGMAAVFIPLISILAYARLSDKNIDFKKFGPGVLTGLGLTAGWAAYMLYFQGPAYLNQLFIRNELKGFFESPLKIFPNWAESVINFLAYGLPWVPFLFPAVFLSIQRIRKNHPDKKNLTLLLIWFCAVFLSYSLITPFYQPRILLLMIPFAILTSYFFGEEFDVSPLAQKAITFFRKHLILIALTLGTFMLSFVVFLLGDISKIWLPAVLIFYSTAVTCILKLKSRIIAPIFLSILLLTDFSQSGLMNKIGLLPHGTIQKMVQTIRQDYDENTLIAAGRNGVPEEIVQSFFDRKIRDQFQVLPEFEERELDKVLAHPGTVYYFMMARDYERLVKNRRDNTLTIVQEENIFKKKVRLNGKFFAALFTLDEKTVRGYLIDRIYLLKKPGRINS